MIGRLASRRVRGDDAATMDLDAHPVLADFVHFAVALAIGLLLGFERGWRRREAGQGDRVAGLRTFGLIAITGAAAAHLSAGSSGWVLAFAFLGLSVIAAAAHWQRVRLSGDVGLTTMVAAALTFLLGAMAAVGHMSLAAGIAVVAALILGAKRELHGFLERISREEMFATLRLLLISVVLLPLLPDRGFGPYEALNPFRLWLLVVVIAAISWIGYVAVRLAGVRRGLLLTGLAGGLASSTAVAINLGRLARDRHEAQGLLKAGILAAAGMMFPRLLVVVSVVAPVLAGSLLWPFLAAALVAFLAAALAARRSPDDAAGDGERTSPVKNPLDLRTALEFGAILALVMLLSRALADRFGEGGLYALAAISGLADVDAILLSAATMLKEGQATLPVTMTTALIAVGVNTMVKPALAAIGGGIRFGLRLAVPLLIALSAGAGVAWWQAA